MLKTRGFGEGNDEEAYMRLYNAAFGDYEDIRDRSISWECLGINTRRHGLLRIDRSKNDPVGYVVAGVDVRLNDEKSVEYGWVLDTRVLKPYRRKRISLTLLLRSMHYVRSLGMSDVLLYSDEMNPTGAMKLYRKVGFRTLHKSMIFRLRLA